MDGVSLGTVDAASNGNLPTSLILRFGNTSGLGSPLAGEMKDIRF